MKWFRGLSMATLAISIMLSGVQLEAALHEDHPYSFEIRRDPYQFTTYFQIKSKDTYIGTVKKSSFRLKKSYDLSDVHGWQATGIYRIMSLGLLYTWAAELDLYDTRGVQFAMIDGQFATLENAKFSLYEYDDNGHGTHVGTAYLDRDCDTFTIYPPDGSPHPLALLQRRSDNGTKAIDYWAVEVYRPEVLDDRLVRIFAAFVMDHQKGFLPPGH